MFFLANPDCPFSRNYEMNAPVRWCAAFARLNELSLSSHTTTHIHLISDVVLDECLQLLVPFFAAVKSSLVIPSDSTHSHKAKE